MSLEQLANQISQSEGFYTVTVWRGTLESWEDELEIRGFDYYCFYLDSWFERLAIENGWGDPSLDIHYNGDTVELAFSYN